MIKKTFLAMSLFLFCYGANAQLFYKNELASVDGVEINYRFARLKALKKDSPLTLRFKLKNTNDKDVKVNFNLVYELGLIDRYESGDFEICIPKNRTRKGKRHELVFEVLVESKEDFDFEENYWEFEYFNVKKIDNCK